MINQAEFHQLLSDFSKYIGLDAFTPEGDHAVFGVDEIRLLNIRRDSLTGVVKFFMEIGQIPASEIPEISKDLLRANIWMIGSHGGALGLDPDTGVVSLTQQHNFTAILPEEFKCFVESFLETAEFWIDRITTSKTAFAEIDTLDSIEMIRA